MYEVVETYGAARLLQSLVADVSRIVDKIFSHAALKEPSVLQYHTELLSEFASRHLADRHSVNAYVAVLYLVESHKQIDHSRLACAGGTYDSYLLPRHGDGGKVLDYYPVAVFIAELDVIEFHLALNIAKLKYLVALVLHLFRFQKFKYPFACGCRRLQRLN